MPLIIWLPPSESLSKYKTSDVVHLLYCVKCLNITCNAKSVTVESISTWARNHQWKVIIRFPWHLSKGPHDQLQQSVTLKRMTSKGLRSRASASHWQVGHLWQITAHKATVHCAYGKGKASTAQWFKSPFHFTASQNIYSITSEEFLHWGYLNYMYVHKILYLHL